MSLERGTMMDLMAYADGELEGEELARVELLLVKNEEARNVLIALTGELPEAVGAWLESAQEPHLAKADGVADAVMAKIAADEKKSSEQRERVRDELAVARAKRTARMQLGVAVAAVAAIAAGVLTYVRTDETPKDRNTGPIASVAPEATTPPPAVSVPQPAADPVPESNALAAVEQPGVEVNEVESPSGDVSVFYLPPTSGAAADMNPTSVVIWIGDDKLSPGGN